MDHPNFCNSLRFALKNKDKIPDVYDIKNSKINAQNFVYLVVG